MALNLEINFQRLLSKCEDLAAEQKHTEWRFENYVSTLSNMLKTMSKASNKPAQDAMKEYSKKVEFLKELASTSKLTADALMTTTLMNPGPIITSKDTKPKQIYHQTQQNQEKKLKDELFSVSKNATVENDRPASSETDIDTLLLEHQRQHDKIAEELIEAARHIKDNSLTARKILEGDKDKLTKINTVADKNYTDFRRENERVNKHVQKCCNWWIWIMVGVVFAIFIWMILFMKIFPKRKYNAYTTPETPIYDLNNNSNSYSENNFHKEL